jgi:hypothetical protein
VVAARIGSNLSISTQFLFITPEGMKWIPTASDNLDKRKKREVINILSEQE